MNTGGLARLWAKSRLLPRLVLAGCLAILVGGGIQHYLLLYEGAAEYNAARQRQLGDVLQFLAPLVADRTLGGNEAAIERLLDAQVRKLEIARLTWTDRDGRQWTVADDGTPREAPAWFDAFVSLPPVADNLDVRSGTASLGRLAGEMSAVSATNRMWAQSVRQFEILVPTLLLMLYIVWCVFRGNFGTLRMLAIAAHRFSRGDHATRIRPAGAPEVRAAAEAFNEMAASIERLIASHGESEANSRRIAAIVEQSSEAIWTRDLSGRVTTWNTGATRLFGYTAEEALGGPFTISPHASEPEKAERLQRLRSGETFTYETSAVSKSGREIEIEVATTPLHDENGELAGKIYVAHEITERKRAQSAIQAARESAEAANRAKSSFLARMSHEIRTPMNGVLGMTELLLETGLTPTQRRFAETVQRSGKSLLGIINDILDLSKIEAGKLELERIDFDLRQTIEDAVELLAQRAQSKGLELTCSLPVDLTSRLKGDPLRLGQIVTNLLGNAIKFTEHGEVAVAVSRQEDATRTTTLRFEVTDTGPGIPADAQERIFESFSQADGATARKHGGTGLGLAISRQLVELMGGTMRVQSEQGLGSTFSFSLQFEKDVTQASDIVASAQVRGMRALIVTANARIRVALNAQIAHWRLTTDTADSLEHAIQVLRSAAERGACCDIVIIDSALPAPGPLALARAIKADAALANARLVMLMPVGRHGEMREARHAGIHACVSKPVRQCTLYECVLNIVKGAPENPPQIGPSSPVPEIVRRHSGGRLLLAEDNPINQQVALGILKIEGYQVTVANNGLEAVNAYAQAPFDLILMDCHMPEMDGFEATRKIRQLQKEANLKRIPIVALTANAMQQDREECLNAGMDDHLSKPYSRHQLRAFLEHWLVSDPIAGQRDPLIGIAKMASPVHAEVAPLRVVGDPRSVA
jgi:PAS domain S-box-containing protein